MSHARALTAWLAARPKRGWLLALIPAIVIAWWLTGQIGEDAGRPQQDLAQLPPGAQYDGYGTGIRSHVFDEQGELLYTVSATAQRLFPGQLTELDDPLLYMYEDNQQRWNISARSGRIRATSGGEVRRLDLEESVEVTYAPDSTESVTLRTPWLVVEPALRRLHTDAEVLLRGERVQQRAIGLQADYSLNSLDFLSNVEGRLTRTEN